MTYYEFCHATDKMKQDMDDAHLYIIAKRKLPIMTLNSFNSDIVCMNVVAENNSSPIELIIRASDNPEVFPSGFYSIKTASNLVGVPPEEKFHYFSLASGYGDNEDGYNFDFHTNFDRLVHLAHHGLFNIKINGDIKPFITYEVLYVGQCAKQHITKRFKIHHAISLIMGNETIVPKDHDKNEEIIIIPFKVNSIEMTSITSNSSKDDICKVIKASRGTVVASDNDYVRDCEKALIRALNPKYNEKKFLNYPRSEDGLYKYDFDSIGYVIDEDIILSYNGLNKIYGGSMGKSIILVKDNEDFSIVHII